MNDRWLKVVLRAVVALEKIAEGLPNLIPPVVVDMSKVSEEEMRNIKPGSIIREYPPDPMKDCPHRWLDTYSDGILQNLECDQCGMEITVPLKMIQRSFAVVEREKTDGT